jgi:PAT family beta-lactamase induction signal transducer AmpG
MPRPLLTILNNSRLLAVFFLGFSAGLPLALTGSTLQAWFTESHINIVTIGMLSLLGIPYTLKFLWAPLMDHYRLPVGGHRRAWIILMQFGLILTIAILANMQPATQPTQMGIVALVIAFWILRLMPIEPIFCKTMKEAWVRHIMYLLTG